jgi:Hemocyanin, ig-like domain/Hemocyanin, copper containing domain
MPTLAELRDRSDALFTELLQAQTRRSPRRGRRLSAVAGPAGGEFSWFDPDDARAAAALAFALSAFAASGDGVEHGLSSALDHVDEQKGRAHPEQVRQGFALFVTHNRDGRRLAKPRTVAAAPGLFSPPRAGRAGPAISVGGPSPGLDYWREDVLANEHHQHWHEVYPYTGLPPRRFDEWVAERTTDEMVAILEAIDPGQQWGDIVPGATPAQLAGLFAQVVDQDLARDLPAELYGKLFRLNDRQGELFFYMHQQMLARYDAELLSNGLPRVEPYGPDAWGDPIAAGHDPIEIVGFGRREPEKTLPPDQASVLQALWHEIDDALTANNLVGPDGGAVAIQPTNLGEAVEATVSQLRDLAQDAYRGLHNAGHGFISQLAKPRPGVMTSTVTAIRDPIFWQWHKCVDDLNARWQSNLGPYDLADSPPVLLRNALDGAPADTPWASPDIILSRTADLPAGAEPAQLGKDLFGGANWSADFAAAQASANGTSLQTIDQLTTRMAKANFGGRPVWYLTHEPFSYFVRVENTVANPVDVTIRIYLVPAEQAADRRLWMEMDKFLVELAAGEKLVVYRPDTESSIVKRPKETSPAAVTEGGSGPDENSYCDCGWPYTLLLPRGKPEGMLFRLLIVCTDAAIDRVAHQEHCGSMSYCGAVDRYPDTRDMGYPFSRPFDGPAATAIQDKIVALNSAAARTVTIRHA